MDNKNVFVAIALSMSVLLFWGAFFETPKKDNQNLKLTLLKFINIYFLHYLGIIVDI